MVTVAVAGGTGDLGRTIVDALKASPKHQVIVLARKESKGREMDVPVFGVDYADIESVTQVLEQNKVHTVISALAIRGPVEGASEISLVKAATKANTTKRFMASEFGTLAPEEKDLQLPQHEHRLATIAELQKTDLEWTRLHNGYFLDYFGIPYIESNMTPVAFAVDMANKAAAIPGTGNDMTAFTYTKDVAKFVVAALDLEHWDEALFCYGDKVTWNEFLAIAEEMRGSKFTVAYDSAEKLASGEMTELPSHPAIYPFWPKPYFQQYFSKFGLYVMKGLFNFPEDATLNKKFPEIKPTTVREMLGVWVGK
ncbi:uncharacterized protein Z520_10301 [Fonsecaea multimorphosa CBS 102226]|uniref:NAD(P)-binding domain-containing protein n=1 Tax=Fonsecaea multimorphosa CBS 102226 TaxID=1442371 RepID=A0A0D2JU28_9EURO|nr:uncharacterized protein Z520_10301 [Fonsecaea multimorphosa CBS 102226]KIX93964.1 hypothetical protein Z520_10301 [Fonsecaea multimorphosa CBS 102226]OAL19312.1 hypothetical protein AYO22_09856 [Fonsecaea multimorphosa]